MENETSEVVTAELVSVGTGGQEIDIQIATAKKYPRSIETFRKSALGMATIDEDTAARCFYVLPRGGKSIEGPGVRLSEICAVAYKNLRYGQRYVGETEDRKSVIGEGFCFDMENNVASRIEITRRIVDKHGVRYQDSVIETTKLAACAIAKRQAIFNVIPMMFINDIYEQCKRVAVGKATSFSAMRQKWIEHFARYGVTPDRILVVLGKPSVDDVDVKDLETLIGLHTAIKDGETDIDKAFPAVASEKPTTLADKVKAAAAKSATPTAQEEVGQTKLSTTESKPVPEKKTSTLTPEEKAVWGEDQAPLFPGERQPGQDG